MLVPLLASAVGSGLGRWGKGVVVWSELAAVEEAHRLCWRAVARSEYFLFLMKYSYVVLYVRLGGCRLSCVSLSSSGIDGDRRRGVANEGADRPDGAMIDGRG